MIISSFYTFHRSCWRAIYPHLQHFSPPIFSLNKSGLSISSDAFSALLCSRCHIFRNYRYTRNRTQANLMVYGPVIFQNPDFKDTLLPHHESCPGKHGVGLTAAERTPFPFYFPSTGKREPSGFWPNCKRRAPVQHATGQSSKQRTSEVTGHAIHCLLYGSPASFLIMDWKAKGL